MTGIEASQRRDHVVVGTDGSDAATAAVVWAAREAALRGMPLLVVHGFVWPLVYAPLAGAGYLQSGEALRSAAEQILADAEDAARQAAPGVSVETSLVEAYAAAALLRAGHHAVLVVVGTRGLGGFSELLVGSTAAQLAMYATCPVVVVRGNPSESSRDRPVVVGVDASHQAGAAVGFGFEEAAVRGAPLHLVHAWTDPVSSGTGDMRPLVFDPAEAEQDAERLLAKMTAALSGRGPDVTVHRRLVRGRPQKVLVEASRDAQLLVVGARGVGGFRGLLFGSVSQAMIHHADCPVAVVRQPA